MASEEWRDGISLSLHTLPLSYILPTAALGLLAIFTLYWMRAPEIPTVNSYAGDITLKKAHAEYISNARGLVAEGFRRVMMTAFKKPWYTHC